MPLSAGARLGLQETWTLLGAEPTGEASRARGSQLISWIKVLGEC